MPKKLDSTPNFQAEFDLSAFYRSEFKKVSDTLVSLSFEHLINCILTVKPLFNVLTVPLSTKFLADDFEKIIQLFTLGYNTSKISVYSGVHSKF